MVIIESSIDHKTLRFCLLAAIGVSQLSFGFAVSINISIKIKRSDIVAETRVIIKQRPIISVRAKGGCSK
ncbi:MAG: hypothetical protein II110_08565, partial [Treponema sp.]|nr:hypothetical protein [Treponema sp.]